MNNNEEIWFTVSCDGGKTGIYWRQDVKECLDYLEPHKKQMRDYCVVAVRKAVPTHKDFLQNVAEVGAMQESLNSRAMIYQVVSKEMIAQLVGLPIDSLYHISYEDYRSISSLVEMMRDKAYKYYLLNKEEVEAYYKANKSLSKEGLVMGDIWNYYFVKNQVDLTVIKNSCNMAIDNIKSVC